jgi:hypothetical protein
MIATNPSVLQGLDACDQLEPCRFVDDCYVSENYRTSAPPCGEQRREQRATTVEALQRAVANPWTQICAALRSLNELRCFSHRR